MRGPGLAGVFPRALIAACLVGAAPRTALAQRWWEPVGTRTPEPTSTPAPTATPERCNPAVLDHEPSEPFDLIGIIEVAPERGVQGPDAALSAAKTQACSLGADAMVILSRGRSRPGGARARSARAALAHPTLKAAAIRYRQR